MLAIVLFALGELNSYSSLILFGLLNIFYLVTITAKPFKIVIDQDKSILELYYLVSPIMGVKKASLQNVESSFNYEIISKGGAKARILKIKCGNKILAALLSDYNGWDEKNLATIFEQLNNLKKLN